MLDQFFIINKKLINIIIYKLVFDINKIKMSKFLYIYNNVSLTNKYKIGLTELDPIDELNQLNTIIVNNNILPTEYELVNYINVNDLNIKYNKLKNFLKNYKINRNFYEFDDNVLNVVNNYIDNIKAEHIPTYKKLRLEYINNKYLTKSQILKCKINKNNVERLKYNSILKNVYNIIDNKKDIINLSNIRIINGVNTDCNWNYIEKHNFSYQSRNANITLKEIISQCINNNIPVKMTIKLKNNKIIKFNL